MLAVEAKYNTHYLTETNINLCGVPSPLLMSLASTPLTEAMTVLEGAGIRVIGQLYDHNSSREGKSA
jgi:hypothetical protein